MGDATREHTECVGNDLDAVARGAHWIHHCTSMVRRIRLPSRPSNQSLSSVCSPSTSSSHQHLVSGCLYVSGPTNTRRSDTSPLSSATILPVPAHSAHF